MYIRVIEISIILFQILHVGVETNTDVYAQYFLFIVIVYKVICTADYLLHDDISGDYGI